MSEQIFGDALCVCAETFTTGRTTAMAQPLTVSETKTGLRVYGFADVLHAAETDTPYRSSSLAAIADALLVGEGFGMVRAMALSQSLTVSEVYTPSRAANFADAVRVTEAFTPLRQAGAAVHDSLTLTERYRTGRTETVADPLHIGEPTVADLGTRLSSALSVTEVYTPARAAIATLAQALRIGETYTPATAALAIVSDELFIVSDSYTSTGSADTVAWSANTDTWGMSRFTGYGVNSIAVIDGALFGAGDAGLFRLDADTDAGTAIVGSIRTGNYDFGDEHTKRLRILYAGATTGGGLQATIFDRANGVAGSNTYPFEARGGAEMTTQRAKLARGVRSRYWSIQISNASDGKAFAIDTLSFGDDVGSRRV